MWVKVYMDSFTSSHVVGWWKFPPNRFGGKLFPILFTYEAWTRLGGCHTGVWRGCLPVGAVSELFFFFFSTDSLWLGSIHTNLASILTNSCRTGTIWPKSSRIGRIGSYRPAVLASDWNGRYRLKSALNEAQTS